jgi:nucleoside-diphosphate-sugar epimerase
VFHAANDMRVRTRATTWKVGVEGTRQLHRAAAQAGAQAFLFVSSFAVYGGGVAAEESAELRPWGEVYGDGKIQAEGALRERASGGPRVVVLRLPAVYGPGSAGWTVRPLAEARRRTLRVPGAGGFAFPYLYVENMVDAATAAALSDREGTYNIHDGWTSYAGFMGFYARMTGSEVRPTSWSVLAVAAAAAELWGRLTGRPPRITRAVLRTVRSLPGPGPNLPAADRAARELGWRPRVSLEAGMAAIRESAQLQDPAASVQGGKLEANDSSRRGG